MGARLLVVADHPPGGFLAHAMGRFALAGFGIERNLDLAEVPPRLLAQLAQPNQAFVDEARTPIFMAPPRGLEICRPASWPCVANDGHGIKQKFEFASCIGESR